MNLNFDQYEDRSQELAELARAVNMLVSVLMNKDGQPRDIADKEGREALYRAISSFPREIPAELTKSDRELLKAAIQECQETKQMMKTWFWWVVGLMFLASSTISLCAVMLLK